MNCLSALARNQATIANANLPVGRPRIKWRMPAITQRNVALLLNLLLGALNVSAGIVETMERATYEGEIRWSDNGNFSVQTSNGVVHHLTLDQLLWARLDSSLTLKEPLPRGWSAENIHRVQGSSGEKDGIFTLEARGGEIRDNKHQAVHFMHRVLRADGEMVACVQSVSGSAPCLAGVMMRENLESSGGVALLGVTPQKTLHLEIQQHGWHTLQRQNLGPVTLPVWLKLVRHEMTKRLTAWRSKDGMHWQEVGQGTLGCRVEPFPENTDHWRPKLHAGLAITGTGNDETASASFSRVVLTAYGLLGEYFADSRFQKRVFSRPDDKIEFWWGEDSPSPEMEPDHFGVRWTGQLQSRYSEDYRFLLDADNDGWLWLDDQEVMTARFNKEGEAKAIPLTAGRKYALRLEFKEGAGTASVRLGWVSQLQPAGVISASHLACALDATSPEEEALETATNAMASKGIWLRHGSRIAGAVKSADETAMRLAFAGRDDFSIPMPQVARVIFQNLRRNEWLAEINDQTGVLLKSGDLLNAEFVILERGSLTIRSLLFGQRAFRLDNGQVVALMLRGIQEAPAAFELQLNSGSVLRINGLRAAGKMVLIQDTSLGQVVIPQEELAEIRRTGVAPHK